MIFKAPSTKFMIYSAGKLPSYEDGELMRGNVFDKVRGNMYGYGWYAYKWEEIAIVLRNKRYHTLFLEGSGIRKMVPFKALKEKVEIVGLIPIGSKMGGGDGGYLELLNLFPKLSLDEILEFDEGCVSFDDNYEFRPEVYPSIW